MNSTTVPNPTSRLWSVAETATFLGVPAKTLYQWRHLGRSSRRDYREYLGNYVLAEWGATPVNKVRFEDVSDWVNRLVRNPGKRGANLSPSYVRKVYGTLSQILAWAVKSGRIIVNPAKGVTLPMITPSRHVYLDHLQVEQLASHTGEHRVLVPLLAYTGLRQGEVSALKAGRIDLKRRRIHVEETHGRESGKLYVDTPKNHEQRAVPIPGFLVKELRSLLKAKADDDLAFTAPMGGPPHYDNFRRRVFAPAVQGAGLAGMDVTAHKLRHTAASLAIASGADVKAVQTMLGLDEEARLLVLDNCEHVLDATADVVAQLVERCPGITVLATSREPFDLPVEQVFPWALWSCRQVRKPRGTRPRCGCSWLVPSRSARP